MVIINNLEDMSVTEKKVRKVLEARFDFTQEPHNVLETERLGTPYYDFNWELCKSLLLKDEMPMELAIPVYTIGSDISHRAINISIKAVVELIDDSLSFETPNTAEITFTGKPQSMLIKINMISYVYEYEIDYTKPLILKYTDKEMASFEAKNYVEQPSLVYNFCKRPQIDYTHFRYFDDLIERANKIDMNTCSKYPQSVESMEKYLYPLFFKRAVKYDFAKKKRYTNMFIFSDNFIWENNNGNTFSLFIINDNDGVMAFLQAFAELYQYVDVEATKATMISLNSTLYHYMDFDTIEKGLKEIGIARTENIFDRIKNKYFSKNR